MIVKNIHEKLLNTIQQLLIDTKVNLPYYGEMSLYINFHEQESIGTCGVNVGSSGMNYYYAPKFLETRPQNEINFVHIHELFHLIFDHPKRTITGQYDHRLSNIAQDMIINHVIWEDINHSFIEMPKSDDGKNMTLFVPKEYKGKLIFEEIYEWLMEEKEKWEKEQKKSCQCPTCKGTGKKESDGKKGDKGDGQGESCPDCDGTGNQDGKDSSGKPAYGPYGKNPGGKEGTTIETWSTDQIFQDMEKNNGQYMDVHMGDDVPESMRDALVKDVMDRLASRGLVAGNIESTLNKLRKKRKDYLKEIKRSISNMIFGTVKQKTIVKPNRRGIMGLKGNRKVKTKIVCCLDTSGSMQGGLIERVLNYIYKQNIEVILIQGDTEIKNIKRLKDTKKLNSIKISGGGGTVLNPMLRYVAENHNDLNVLVLTDGYCDKLITSDIKGRVLILSVGTKVPMGATNGRTKQIVVEKDN